MLLRNFVNDRSSDNIWRQMAAMGRVTRRDNEVLNQLVLDCDLYNLNEREALEYIKVRLGKEISDRTYRRYRENVRNGTITQEWLNYYTKVGFIVEHQELVECAKKLLSGTWQELQEEKNKPVPEFSKIAALKHEYREDVKLFDYLKFGTPILARIKKNIQDYKDQLEEKSQRLFELENQRI